MQPCRTQLRAVAGSRLWPETRVRLWRWLVRVLATQRGLATSRVSVRFTGGKSEDGVGKTGIPLWSGNPPCGHSDDLQRLTRGAAANTASPSPPARKGTAPAAPGSGVWIPSILQSARLVSHYARCIPSKALYRRCLQRCSDKRSYRTGLERPRVAEAKCNTGCSTIEHRHSPLPSCEVGIAP
jgi:hypothetical protein